MWKSGLKMSKEKWAILLVCGMILLVLAFPFGGGRTESSQKEGSPSYGGDSALPGSAGQGTSGPAGADGLGSGGGADRRDSFETSGKAGAAASDAERAYEQELEQRVKEILKNVQGVGQVDVMIRLKSSREKVLRVDKDKSRSSNEEKDSAGGTRQSYTEEVKESTLMSGGNGEEEPVVEKELQPEIAGIVVSAQGGGSAVVKEEISEAMQALFDLPAHKIKVLKRVE